ncbi:MAG TPA: hypothetical protein VN684_05290 [Terriglobales bacterium]|nr:hypothetical protein [Terriglobales bacterium]
MRRAGIIGLCIASGIIVSVIAFVVWNRSGPRFESFTFSPDGKYIAAVYSNSDSSFIYKIPLATGLASRFTKATEGFEGTPSFSPDGKQLAYSYWPKGKKTHSYIVIMNPDGLSSFRWPPSDADDFSPVFSSNKSIIFGRSGYYGSYSPIAQPHLHEWNFFVSDLDGTNVRQITNENFFMVSRVSVSTESNTMLFVSTEDHGDVMYIYSIENPSSPRVVLKPNIEVEPGDPIYGDSIFMPGDESILFTAATQGASSYYDYDIYKMNMHSQKIDKLTNSNGYAYGLQLSRDGKTAIFMRDVPHWYGDRTEVLLLDIKTHRLKPFIISGLQ